MNVVVQRSLYIYAEKESSLHVTLYWNIINITSDQNWLEAFTSLHCILRGLISKLSLWDICCFAMVYTDIVGCTLIACTLLNLGSAKSFHTTYTNPCFPMLVA